jgi:hypothetical protein
MKKRVYNRSSLKKKQGEDVSSDIFAIQFLKLMAYYFARSSSLE